METKWITFKGQQILVADYRGATKKEEMIGIINEAYDIVSKSNSPVKSLSYFEGTYLSREFLQEARVNYDKYRNRVDKQALIGISGIKKILADAYARFTKSKDLIKIFEKESDALEWLVE